MKNGMYYSVERRHCISSSPVKTRLSKREHVKGRLDFDSSDVAASVVDPQQTIAEEISMSESDKDADLFDFDLPSLDAFGPDFSFSELLVDLGIDCDQIDYPSDPTFAMDTISGSSPESGEHALGANQVMSVFFERERNVFRARDEYARPKSVTEMKSMTKCIRIMSPVKGGRSSLNKKLS